MQDSKRYRYKGLPLTPSVSKELILELFEGKTAKRGAIYEEILRVHLSRGGLPGEAADGPRTLKKALETLKTENRAENPLTGHWRIHSSEPGATSRKETEVSEADSIAKSLTNSSSDFQVETYSENDFLSEVYIDKEKYLTLKRLLFRKKNLILLGAPGVGKTFAAERLAYSLMEEKDEKRLQVVQFHQSYSYEDFIMGYRPSAKGFYLSRGPFYQFCKKAELDGRPHFFIIDEINRGNLSKIFGELLMLIEDDKRGKELRVLYTNEQFSVPENVFIIGMMNTADRSLAMIDYALRRRFAFFEFEPAFESEGFKEHQSKINNGKFDSLIQSVIAMNIEIAEDAALGSGFRIGHSYFSGTEIDDYWLEELVEYELIPLITEYWFDEPSQIAQWSGKLRGAIR